MKDDYITILRCISHLRTECSSIAKWITGSVVTDKGLVSVFSGAKMTSMIFVHQGRLYRRTFAGRPFTELELVRLSKKFVRETIRK